MQTKDEIEQWYQTADPWGYETNPDDIERKKRILAALSGRYSRALDIGCGEGWITKDLPAKTIHGLELSDTARTRIPKPAVGVIKPMGKYDLIVLTGVLYRQYDYKQLGAMAENHLTKYGTLLLCHIEDWVQPLPGKLQAVLQHQERFPYREYTELLEVYKCV